MSKRKFYGLPYSDRHIRRLKLANRSLFFQEAHTTFNQISNLPDTDTKEKTNDNLNISGTFSEEKEIIYSNAILNSLVNGTNYLELSKSTNLESLKESENDTSKNEIISHVLAKVEADGKNKKENIFENQIAVTDVVTKDNNSPANFDNLILCLNGIDDFDEGSDSDEDEYDDSDHTKTAV